MAASQRNDDARQDRQASTTVAVLAPSRLPISSKLADEFDIQPLQWRVLVEQVFPSAKTVEAVAMALAYCRERQLDIFKRPVHIVPVWSSAKGKMVETVWPGIAEIRTTASRTGAYAGIDEVEFGLMTERTFEGRLKSYENNREVWKDEKRTVRYPEWAAVTVYRMVHGVRCAYRAKVFWEETYATIGKSEIPNDMWAKRARGQLDKCVEAAALRKAFPEELGNTYAAEEMEGRVFNDAIDVEIAAAPARLSPPSPARPPSPSAASKGAKAPSPTRHVEPDEQEHLNPDDIFRDAEEQLCVVQDVETWEEVWANFQHFQQTLFPPDWEHLVEIGETHRVRVDP